MSPMLLFFLEEGRDVVWKDGVLEGFFFLSLSSSVCLNTDVHHSEMAHFNPRMMVPTNFLPSPWNKDEPCSESHKLQK